MRPELAPAGQLLGALGAVLGLAICPLEDPMSRYGLVLATLLAIVWQQPRAGALFKRALVTLPMLAGLLLPVAIGHSPSRALHMALRAACSLTTALAFTAHLTASQLPSALATLHLPRPLVVLLATIARQVGSIQQQGQRIVLARKLRGASGNVVNAEVLASLLTETAGRADRIQLAMSLRGAGEALAAPQPWTRADLVQAFAGLAIGATPHALAHFA